MSDVTVRITTALADRYKIIGQVGEGGMATVYLAEDLKHERKVAVKVLRPELAAVIGADRFLHEIKLTASLQHPNILPLYDSGAADSFLFYVMPYVEGESLRDRLDRERQLPVAEAVRLASQVASALDYAHRQGVIHRDIKPANVLLHDGQALVADFGIALAVSAAGGSRMTETGMSLGTPHYMSPEQASADRDLDGRSDLYALGVMLYEMLAGAPPFHGASAQSIVAKILTQEAPPVSSERATVPPHIEAAVATSLAKLPADRFDTAEAFRSALEDETYGTTNATAAPVSATDAPAPSAGRVRGRAESVAWTAAALFALLAAFAWLKPPPSTLVQRYEVVGSQMIGTGGTPFDISPDGSTLVYIGEGEQVFWRPIAATEAQVVPNSARSRSPFFSPDGRSIGFTTGPPANDVVRTVSLDGAPPRTLSPDHFPGARWGDDGFVYFVDIHGALYRTAAQGGSPETLKEGGVGPLVRFPEPLPGGRTVIVHTSGENPERLLAFDLERRDFTQIEEGTHASFVAGHLFWVNQGTLFAAPFDPETLEFMGRGIAVADRVRPSLQGSYEYAVSETGTLLYRAAAGDVAKQDAALLGWVDEQGAVAEIDGLASSAFLDIDNIALSSDERFVALEVGSDLVSLANSPSQIYVYDFDQRSSQRLTFRGSRNAQPRWMPDGRHLAYLSDQADGPDGIWMQPFDRTGDDELLAGAEVPMIGFDLSPVEGDPIIVQTAGATPDLWLARPGDTKLEPYLVTEFTEWRPRISPDGKWVAYESNESGRMEVYVRAFPDGGRPWPISRDGGHRPVWSRSGDVLYYETPPPDEALAMERLALGEDVRVLEHTRLFSTGRLELGAAPRSSASYDLGSDEGRFLMILAPGSVDASGESRTFVVLNIFEELKGREGG
jgi:eukaryotic-like serine/threonine-protein kinase